FGLVLLLLPTGGPTPVIEPRVSAAGPGQMLSAGGHSGLPVEDDAVVAADDHGLAGFGADAEELVLDADGLQPVGQVAHGLIVAEVGLLDPQFGLGAADPPQRHHAFAGDALLLGGDGEALLADRLGPY